MFDFASELFGFMNQRPRYERELKEDGLAYMTDCQKLGLGFSSSKRTR